MKVTEVRLSRVEGTGNLKAYADVTFDGVFAVHGLRIMEGKNGLFVGMPNRKLKSTGEFKDVAHPVTREFKDELQEAVLNEYNK